VRRCGSSGGERPHLTGQIARLTEQITTAVQGLPGPEKHTRPGPSLVERLDAMPGVRPTTAHILLAELGPNMAVFPTADHLASWAIQTHRQTPRAQEGPGRRRPLNPDHRLAPDQ
jgi:transposase